MPDNIFSRTGKWVFELTREVSCDAVLEPYYLSEPYSYEEDGQVWTVDPPPSPKFLRPEESQNIPPDEVLPCYLVLSVKEK